MPDDTVHELRHKRYAKALHSQVAGVLRTNAPYVVCDHFLGAGGMSNDQLYMSPEEHRQALFSAGFWSVEQVKQAGSLVMYRAQQCATC